MSTAFPVPLSANIFDILQEPVDMESFSKCTYAFLIGIEGRDNYSH
jgi:hypothetical protein